MAFLITMCFSTIFLQTQIPPVIFTTMVIILLLLLVLSFIITGAESSFFTLSAKDISFIKTKQNHNSKIILELLQQPKSFLVTLHISSTLINIAIIIFCNFLADMVLADKMIYLLVLPIKVIVIATILILFTEFLPKIWASTNDLRFVYSSAFLVNMLHQIFGQISHGILKYTDGIERSLGGGNSSNMSMEELDQAINLTTPKDATEEEKNMLKGIVKFGNITVRQVMKTRLDVQGIDDNSNFVEVLQKVEALGYSRYPVYKESLDQIIGILQTKDLIPHLHENQDFDWHKLLRQPLFVHEYKLIEDLLKELQVKRVHFAIVVDEFGGTEGIITLEDIMEEVIGDIQDEFDEEDSIGKKIDDDNYLFEGKSPIIEVCRFIEVSPLTFDKYRGDSETIAGLFLEITGEIPAVNNEITIDNFTLTVLELEKNRIKKLKLTVKAPKVVVS
jgi:gliding motility-associated protein GldE